MLEPSNRRFGEILGCPREGSDVGIATQRSDGNGRPGQSRHGPLTGLTSSRSDPSHNMALIHLPRREAAQEGPSGC